MDAVVQQRKLFLKLVQNTAQMGTQIRPEYRISQKRYVTTRIKNF